MMLCTCADAEQPGLLACLKIGLNPICRNLRVAEPKYRNIGNWNQDEFRGYIYKHVV